MLKVKADAPDDLNPQETSEWVEALDQIIDEAGPDRASYVINRLMERAANFGVQLGKFARFCSIVGAQPCDFLLRFIAWVPCRD